MKQTNGVFLLSNIISYLLYMRDHIIYPWLYLQQFLKQKNTEFVSDHQVSFLCNLIRIHLIASFSSSQHSTFQFSSIKNVVTTRVTNNKRDWLLMSYEQFSSVYLDIKIVHTMRQILNDSIQWNFVLFLSATMTHCDTVEKTFTSDAKNWSLKMKLVLEPLINKWCNIQFIKASFIFLCIFWKTD